jgi:hypothetical protein
LIAEARHLVRIGVLGEPVGGGERVFRSDVPGLIGLADGGE